MRGERGGGERRRRELTDATTMARRRDVAEVAAGGDFGSLTASNRKTGPPRHLENFRALALSYIGAFLQAVGIDHRL
jgi:hypothetical protein